MDKLLYDGAEIGFVFCLPLRLFMNWGFVTVPVNEAAEFVSRYKDIKIVVDNINYSEFTAMTEVAQKCKNVFLGTASETMYNGIEYLVEGVGSDRLLGGTASPLQMPSCGIVKITNAAITDDDKIKLLGLNTEKLLGISATSEIQEAREEGI